MESLEFGATMGSPADAVNNEKSFPSLPPPEEELVGASVLACALDGSLETG